MDDSWFVAMHEGLNRDETTACVDVPVYPGCFFGGGMGEMKMMGEMFLFLKNQNSYLNGHLCPGSRVFIQNDNKKAP